LSAAAKIRLGVLETGAPPRALRETFGDYPGMFRRLLGDDHFDWSRFDLRQGPPEAVDACQAYIVTGSPAGAYDDDPWIAALVDFLRAAKGRAALVGVCFGHQVMAQAFGGRVVKSDKGWGIGLHDYALKGVEPWMVPGPVISVPASHQDQVVALPPRARVIGGSAFSLLGMLAYDDQPAISIQLHPEFEPAYAKALIEVRRDLYPDGLAETALASLDAPNDNARVGAWISHFIRSRTSGL
jgi:GMP synthase-like glutamine amidotransferase